MPATAIKSTTQEHLDILDILNDVILLKDGAVALVLQVSAVNFDLLSEEEQEAIIYAYAGLLNSLTFPIQIVIRSQRKDISNYIELLKGQENKTISLKKKQQISQYRTFVSQIVKEGNVLDKKFYCVVPFTRIELGLQASNPLSLKKTTNLPYDKSYIMNKALTTLHPKRDHLIRQFARIGLFARALNTQELTQLFYNAYNPDQAKEKSLAGAERYDYPLVQSRLDFKLPKPSTQQTQPEEISTDTPPKVQEILLESTPQTLQEGPLTPAQPQTIAPQDQITNQPIMQTQPVNNQPNSK